MAGVLAGACTVPLGTVPRDGRWLASITVLFAVDIHQCGARRDTVAITWAALFGVSLHLSATLLPGIYVELGNLV